MTGFARSITCTGQLLHGKYEDPTLSLRFVLRQLPTQETRILQQMWRVTQYNNGEAVVTHYEWRDVPLADETN